MVTHRPDKLRNKGTWNENISFAKSITAILM